MSSLFKTHFLAPEDSRKTDLTEAKGTVILHLTHHAQDNPELVRDYLKHIRFSTWLTERLITPFNLALAFSLTSIEKFQDQVGIQDLFCSGGADFHKILKTRCRPFSAS